jgi:hypothetical protein
MKWYVRWVRSMPLVVVQPPYGMPASIRSSSDVLQSFLLRHRKGLTRENQVGVPDELRISAVNKGVECAAAINMGQ